ncbi:MAG: histidine--tRNA ligase [Armatimonadetes bacterium]|nr:histidine--tRNA ligase [Armatimonadota bacterium]
MRYQAPRGTEDVLPSQVENWLRLERVFRGVCRLYGYEEIRTPTFEDTDLFVRSSGDTSEVVSKQMYSFVDKGGRNVTLKPEGTAPAIRALIEHNLCQPGGTCRLSYITPVFRYERPQKGRLREPHQVGLELVGSASAEADAEVIETTVRFYEALGIEGIRVRLNSIGRNECRTAYREALLAFARPLLVDMPDEFREKAERNPLRLLDSKDPKLAEALKQAPSILDFLEPDSKVRLDTLQMLLNEAGIAFDLDPNIVRGLDYYTETVFEIHSDLLGAQSTLCGGGRYDNLIKELGGPDLPAVGVGIGIERALIVLENRPEPAYSPCVFVVALGEDARIAARGILRTLRGQGVTCTTDLEGRSLKSQLNQANKSGARWAVILGEDELKSGAAALRLMADGTQQSVAMGSLGSFDWGSNP